MARQFFKKVNKFLTRWELKGHNAANTLHRWTINAILLTLAYNIFTIFRGYNETLLSLRVAWSDRRAKKTRRSPRQTGWTWTTATDRTSKTSPTRTNYLNVSPLISNLVLRVFEVRVLVSYAHDYSRNA